VFLQGFDAVVPMLGSFLIIVLLVLLIVFSGVVVVEILQVALYLNSQC
jgi:hypothetical protein